MAANNRDPSSAGWQLVSSVALGANPGATDVFTWTHNRGVRAAAIKVLDSTNKVQHLDATITTTQADANTIALTNTTAGPLTVDILILWRIPSREEIRPITGAALIAAAEAVAS